MNFKQCKEFVRELGLNPNDLIDLGNSRYMMKNYITVNPKMAKNWLDNYNSENRNAKERNIEKMAKDIANGDWQLTHQPMGFKQNKQLGDGQNRLKAIILAGKSIKVLIVFNLTQESILAVDTGAPRTIKDGMKLDGVEVGAKEIAATKFFTGGVKGESNISSQTFKREYFKFKTHLNKNFEWIPSNIKGITAGVRGAITRAISYYENDSEKLGKVKEFCDNLANNTATNKSLGKFFRNLTSQKYGGQGRKAIYFITQTALFNFVNDSNKKNVGKELWPLEGYDNPHDPKDLGEAI